MEQDIYSDVVEHIPWHDFIRSIKVIKLLHKQRKVVEYLGQYKIGKTKYNTSIEFTMNEEYFEDMEYFDGFAHDQIAEELYKQIMQPKRSK